ncbi:hypothetical protein Purlil1_13393 [Purpureocillium lilacinum]|uniref:Uncharacterized protein n=1 Tax=Purpureocillium lilacinum TaxID=33203 RepID=A0ABR0BE56_PURLI|nr:hypothetical protein Purlil1_13393 [Purpureocillium lilacinum]
MPHDSVAGAANRPQGIKPGLVPISLELLRPIEARLLTHWNRHTWASLSDSGARRIGASAAGSSSWVSTVGLPVVHARHVPPILGRAVLEPVHAVGTRELVVVTGHVVHAVLDGNHGKGVDHAVGPGHVVEAIVALVGEAGSLLGLSILLNVGLRMRQVAGSGGVATTNGALLEVTLQDITSGKRITAKHTHVGAIAGVCRWGQDAPRKFR